jgi:hypothetical protein
VIGTDPDGMVSTLWAYARAFVAIFCVCLTSPVSWSVRRADTRRLRIRLGRGCAGRDVTAAALRRHDSTAVRA